MASFIQSTALNGSNPHELMGVTSFVRNSLLMRMMLDRAVVRYLLAPTGYGKTMLAASYARLMVGYESTFWIPGNNPRFLRDLDAGTLAADLLECASAGSLVVFDDVPKMGEDRRVRLHETAERLLEGGLEVVVCSTPGADPLAPWASELVRIDASELLFGPGEYAEMNLLDTPDAQLHAPVYATDSVPSLAVRAPGSFERFLRSHLADADSAREAGASFCMVVLGSGSFSDLERVLGDGACPDGFASSGLCSFARVDAVRRSFDATGFPIREVARAYAQRLGAVAAEYGARSSAGMLMELADMLVERGRAQRACEMLQELCVPAARATWLVRSGQALLDAGELLCASHLFESLGSERYNRNAVLVAHEGVRRFLLGQRERGLSLLGRAVRIRASNDEARVVAYGALRMADARERPADAREQSAGAQEHLGEARSFAVADAAPCVQALGGYLQGEEPAALPDAGWALACMVADCSAGRARPGQAARVAALVGEYALQGPAVHNASTVVLRRLLESSPCPEFDPRVFPCEARDFCDAYEKGLAVQAAMLQAEGAAPSTPEAPGQKLVAMRAPAGAVPHLTVNVFGRFEVLMGQQPVDYADFRRSKVRTLLALLALEDGREISCVQLESKLWPDSDTEKARKNLYSTVSLLRSGLSLPGGACPYVQRSHGVIRLDKKLFSSDAGDLSKLCARLRFDSPDPEAFVRILEQMRTLYRGEVIPGELNEPLIVRARETTREQVVSALLSGSRRLELSGSSQTALRLANYALDCDESREDCYELVMALQAACGQRAAAAETWFRYCRYVMNVLGLDPSQRLQELYARIIGA